MSTNRQQDIELVKVGIAVLRADPKETQTSGAREWVVDVIESYSGRKFSAQARDELLHNKLDFPITWSKDILKDYVIVPLTA
jgi:hypothetical protein